jgi:transcriptional regulator
LYIPKLYREEDREEILAFLGQNNFPALVSFDGEKPLATHTPVEVVEQEDGQLTVYGHLARANPQWATFGEGEILLIFQGAHTYISPRWYNHTNVPTWNYMMIHVYGKIRLVQGDELHALLSRLVQKHETGTGYSLEGLPPDFVQKQMAGIVGFAVAVTRIDAGYKLSQNRSDQDHANIVRELQARGDADSHKVAAAMSEDRDARATRTAATD